MLPLDGRLPTGIAPPLLEKSCSGAQVAGHPNRLPKGKSARLRIGIVSPVVVQHPATASAWERSATVDDLRAIAVAADRLGFEHLTCSEHVAVPIATAVERGGTYWDQIATLSYFAAVTSHIRLVTQVLVLGYHHPLEIAKRYGTLDVLSGGRVTLGVGVGTLKEEFELLGAQFTDRGARADEALCALRAALGRRQPRFEGKYFNFADVVVEPHAQQSRVPLWVGGRSLRSLRRAVAHADGWVPFGLSTNQLAQLVSGAEVPDGFEIVLGPGRPLNPIEEPVTARRALERTAAAGATIVNVGLAADSAKHYCEQLDALAEMRENR